MKITITVFIITKEKIRIINIKTEKMKNYLQVSFYI